MPRTEEKIQEEMCWLIFDPKLEHSNPPWNSSCQVLKSALYSAKSSTKPWGVVPQRVFIQDLAASLNRKQVLSNEKVEEFEQLGYEYMKV
jgi:hypothetical protein